MTRTYRHWIYLLLHKWFVLLAGLRLGVPLWQLLSHDWSKWRCHEWRPYVTHFYDGGAWRDRTIALAEVTAAQQMHVIANPHHWQYWRGREMPQRYVREMLADWEGAYRTKRIPRVARWLGEPPPLPPPAWYATHCGALHLHPHTRAMVELLLTHTFPPHPASP